MTLRVAGPEEVLEVITGIMRGTCTDESGAGPKMAERFRAAELLAKYHRLLETEDGARRQEREAAAREIEAALARLLGRAGEEDAPSSTGKP